MNLEGRALLVFGSRTLDDERIEDEIGKIFLGSDYCFLITALNPSGVCERVKHFAKVCKTGIVLIQIGLDQKRARGMHEARSITALKMADHLLAIWDGSSRGTAGEIRLAKKMCVPTTVVQLEPLHVFDLAIDFNVSKTEELLDYRAALNRMKEPDRKG